MKKICFKLVTVFIIIFYSKLTFSEEKNNELNSYKGEIDKISSTLEKKYNVDFAYSKKVLESIKFNSQVLTLMTNAPERTFNWDEYKKIFISKKRINDGKKYYIKNYALLKEIESKYNVPAELIVAFLGVETNYGKDMGSSKTLDALGTLAFKHERRSEFFKDQLINFILLTYNNKLDYNSIYGSYAGALGAPQFMPSNYIKLGVDYDSNGKIDLWNNKHDIYSSVANYLKKKGEWEGKNIVYSDILIKKEYLKDIFKNGDNIILAIDDEKLNKILFKSIKQKGEKYLILLNQEKEQYKLGYKNFKAIMSYNPSVFYAMVVSDLSKAIVNLK